MAYEGKSLEAISAEFVLNAKLEARERDGFDTSPKNFWLSYSFEGRFFGCIIVHVEGDEISALQKANELNIAPGGNVKPRRLRDDLPLELMRAAGWLEVLLSRDDCIAFDEWCVEQNLIN